MKTRIKITVFPSASPLGKRGEDGGEGFSNSMEEKPQNPHPTLSLGKGEADIEARNANKEA
jgi:hypothetical protein